MYVYVIFKGEQKQGLNISRFFHSLCNFQTIIWDNGKWSSIRRELCSKVIPDSMWKLIIVDMGGSDSELNLFDDMKEVLSDPLLEEGVGETPPPWKTYIIKRCKEYLRGELPQEQKVIKKRVPPSVRFLTIEYREYDYLRYFEELRLICAVILLGNNEFPAELIEAYYVYRISITINIKKLVKYFEYLERVHEKEQNNLDKMQLQIIERREKREYIIYDYLPDLVVRRFDELRLQNKYHAIKKSKDMENWFDDIGNISVSIDRFQREWKSNHDKMRIEMNQKLNMLEGTEIYLGEEEEVIKEKMEQNAEELVPYYSENWRLTQMLFNEKVLLERQMEYMLESRKTWRGIMSLGINTEVLLLILLIPFVGLYMLEQKTLEVLNKFGLVNYIHSPSDRVQVLLILFGIILLMIPPLVLLILLAIEEIQLWNKKTEYKKILGKISKKFKKNFDWHKKFFSYAYQQKSFRNLLVRYNLFRKKERRIKEDLLNKEKELEEKEFELNDIKSHINSFLSGVDIKRDLRGDVEIREDGMCFINVNGERRLLCGSCSFIESVTLEREVVYKED